MNHHLAKKIQMAQSITEAFAVLSLQGGSGYVRTFFF
jgi:hypothetical protein